MRNFKICVLLALAFLGLSSCISDSSNESTASYDFVDNFEYVEDLGGYQQKGFNDIRYRVELGSNGKAVVTINGLKTPDKTAYGTITLPETPYSFAKEGWIEISADNMIASIAGTDVKLTFSRLYLRVVPAPAPDRHPGFFVRYVLDGKYSIFSAPRQQTLYGKTTSTYSGGTYETTVTDYVFTFDASDNTVNILMKNSSFLEQMPRMDILLGNVPFTISGNDADFTATEIIPSIGGTPYPGFEIRNLAGTFEFADDMKMTFRCRPQAMPMDFTVNVDCEFDFIKTE